MLNRVKKILATTLYILGAIKLAAWLRVKVFKQPRIIVLCYHRIIEQGGLISPQCISPTLFEEQVGYFKNNVQVISLVELEQYVTGKKQLISDAVVFTFDDGYEDNYTHAAPILEKHGVKGVFFVASDPILRGKVYWIDELSVILQALYTQKIAVSVETEAHKVVQAFIESPESKKKCMAKEVFYSVNSLPLSQRNSFMDNIRCAVSERPNTPPLMSLEQLKNLVKRGHIIGAHTVTHPRLSLLNRNQVESEVVEGIMALRQHIKNIDYFAYPFGKLEDLPKKSEEAFTLFAKHGIKLAVTTEDAAVYLNESPYLISRKVMSAQSLTQIALKLEMLKWSFNPKSA